MPLLLDREHQLVRLGIYRLRVLRSIMSRPTRFWYHCDVDLNFPVT